MQLFKKNHCLKPKVLLAFFIFIIIYIIFVWEIPLFKTDSEFSLDPHYEYVLAHRAFQKEWMHFLEDELAFRYRIIVENDFTGFIEAMEAFGTENPEIPNYLEDLFWAEEVFRRTILIRGKLADKTLLRFYHRTRGVIEWYLKTQIFISVENPNNKFSNILNYKSLDLFMAANTYCNHLLRQILEAAEEYSKQNP